MERGEVGFIIGAILLVIGALVGAEVKNMLFPGTVALFLIGIVVMWVSTRNTCGKNTCK